MSTIGFVAARAGWLSCPACRKLVRGAPVCPRCATVVQGRKAKSLSRTLALIVTAAILYVPAYIYPLVVVVEFERREAFTIVLGIQTLILERQWIAALVFFASVSVPLTKLLGISFLLLCAYRNVAWRTRDRLRLYRFTLAAGRWAMLDVFVVSILVALVQLDAIATVQPGFGAVAFAGVVIAAMAAVASFDVRLIWDGDGAVRP